MKTVIKSMPEPANLTAFRKDNPDGTWKEMQNDALTHGQAAYSDICNQTIQDQKGVCAYCECRIRAEDKLHRQIEHFHPKSDHSQNKNWALDWQNMLAVCNGGSRSGNQYALPRNLSCDAFKGSAVYDGAILNPLFVPPFPDLFTIDRATGELKPAENTGSTVTIQGNRCDTTKDLIENTINVLNLNCPRLLDLRLAVVEVIENQKAKYREKGTEPKEALLELATRYFSPNELNWPEFFTTIRCCLGQTAEEYLRSIQYQG